MMDYGKYTLEDRAIADFRDGLKPVQRRILWAMHKLGLTHNAGVLKAARIVGDTMGKFHPHGDSAIYGAAVTMANLSTPLIDGKGNWGSLTDGPAAMRYTEGRLTKYADKGLFHPDYVPTLEEMPTYDGKAVEPVVLPSLVPNILVNGTFGIAMGGTAHIPSYELKGLITLVQRLLDDEPVGVAECVKHLKFRYKYGGEAILDKEGLADLRAFYEQGTGGVWFSSPHHVNQHQLSLTFTGFAPNLNIGKVVAKVRELSYVASVDDETSLETGPRYTVFLKKTAASRFVTLSQEVVSYFDSKLDFRVNIVSRSFDASTGKMRARFRRTSIPKLLKNWVAWRLKQERRSLRYLIRVLDKKIRDLELRLLASLNKDTVLKSLDDEEPANYLVKHLEGITLEEADQILGFKILQLHRWNIEDLEARINNLNKQRDDLRYHLKDPRPKMVEDLREFAKVTV